MGVGVAAGRAVKFGERERGAQFEAAGLLALGDGDGGKVGVFGGVGVCRVFLEEKVATRAVDLCVKPALSCAIEVLKRLIDCCQSGIGLTISRFRFRQCCIDERLKGPDSILLKQGGRPAQFKRPFSGEPDRNSTQASRKAPKAIQKAIPCSWAKPESFLARGAARSTFPPINSNMTLCINPIVEVARCPSSAIRFTVASASSRARSISPSGQSTIAK